MKLFQQIPAHVASGMILLAKTRVLFIGPSLTDGIAAALISARQALGDEQVVVVLDYDEQVFRLGYGHYESVKMLEEAGVVVRQQPGLRIGVLILDDQGWVFTLPPMAVEGQHELTFNALTLMPEQVNEVVRTLVTPTLRIEGDPTPRFEIGNAPVAPEIRERVAKAIEQNPPAAFDLQRQVSVYRAHVQFVEIELEGGRIEQRTIKLPKSIKEQAFSKDKAFQERLRASYKLIEVSELDFLREVRDEVEKLRMFTPSLGKRLGRVMLASRKALFMEKVEQLEMLIEQKRQEVVSSLDKQINESLMALAKIFVPGYVATPPNDLLYRCSEVTEQVAQSYILEQLRRESPTGEQLLQGLRLHCTFKDVTLEMLKDVEFQEKVAELFPYESWAKPFMESLAVEQPV